MTALILPVHNVTEASLRCYKGLILFGKSSEDITTFVRQLSMNQTCLQACPDEPATFRVVFRFVFHYNVKHMSELLIIAHQLHIRIV